MSISQLFEQSTDFRLSAVERTQGHGAQGLRPALGAGSIRKDLTQCSILCRDYKYIATLYIHTFVFSPPPGFCFSQLQGSSFTMLFGSSILVAILAGLTYATPPAGRDATIRLTKDCTLEFTNLFEGCHGTKETGKCGDLIDGRCQCERRAALPPNVGNSMLSTICTQKPTTRSIISPTRRSAM